MRAADPDHGNVGDVEENNPVVDNATTANPSHLFFSKLTALVYSVCSAVYTIISHSFCLIADIVSFALTGTLRPAEPHCTSWSFKSCCGSSHTRTEEDVFNQIDAFETTLAKIKRIIIVSLSRVGCLLLIWLLVNLSVPRMRRATLAGSLLWKWSLLGTLVTLGYPITFVAVIMFESHFVHPYVNDANDALYYICYLEGSVRGLIYLSWVLLAWLLYFRTHRGLDLTNSHVIHKYVTSTLVLSQVAAILWGLKRVVGMHWRANAIFKRFKPTILKAGFHLFFLALIVRKEPLCKFPTSWVEQYALSTKMSICQVSWIAYLVAQFAKVESRETDDVSEIIARYKKMIQDNDTLRSEEYVIEEAVRNLTRHDYETDLFLKQLQSEYPSKSITEIPIIEWAVDAHKNCVSMGSTLLDAFATVSVLDTILTCCIVVLIIVLWLLITGLATTTVLVVIASPFLAFTFVFGDACKTFFQGVVFSFIIHPFDVGDRCIIDQTEVEVKRINILTTTFIKIGVKQKMLYPNTDLATKVIINLGSKPGSILDLPQPTVEPAH